MDSCRLYIRRRKNEKAETLGKHRSGPNGLGMQQKTDFVDILTIAWGHLGRGGGGCTGVLFHAGPLGATVKQCSFKNGKAPVNIL